MLWLSLLPSAFVLLLYSVTICWNEKDHVGNHYTDCHHLHFLPYIPVHPLVLGELIHM